MKKLVPFCIGFFLGAYLTRVMFLTTAEELYYRSAVESLFGSGLSRDIGNAYGQFATHHSSAPMSVPFKLGGGGLVGGCLMALLLHAFGVARGASSTRTETKYCPHCNEPVFTSSRPSLDSSHFIRSTLMGDVICPSCKKEITAFRKTNRIKCPECAEPIRPEAKICPHCRSRISLEERI
jgi:DNA-directed RNA polymerase subunit RPC12/RpoP